MSDETTTAPLADESTSRAEDRIRALTQERRQLREQLASFQSQLEAQAEAVKAAEMLKAQVGEWEARYAKAEQSWSFDRELMSRGINDEEARDFVTLAYERLPKEGRPALGEWLTQTDKLPKAIRAYLPDGAPAAAPPATPRANAGAVPTGGQAPSNYSAEAIHNMPLEEYRAFRNTLRKG